MTDEGAPTAPEPTPAPAPDGASGSPSARTPDRPPRGGQPRWVRLVLAVLGAGAIAALVLSLATKGGPRRPVVGGGTSGGSGAVRAPRSPQLPAGAEGERLAGVIVDGAGAPVAGAEVRVELEVGVPERISPRLPSVTPPAGGDGGVSDDPGLRTDAAVAPHDAGVAAASAQPTGSDGRFVLEGLAAGRYRLRVTGTGLLAAELRMVAVPSDEIRVVVARQVSIEGTVTDGGKPVMAAMVGIRGDEVGGTIEVKTDTAGHFVVSNLPEGRYQVYAYQGALAARGVRVARLGAGPFTPVELRLEAATIVVGRVIDRDEGTGLVAAVELRAVGDDQASRYARSGEDGVFRIEGVPSGRWLADAYAPGYLSPGGVELEAGRGVPELSLEPGGTIEGRVVDGEGKPVEGASVRALASGASPVEISALVEQDHLRRYSGRTSAPARTSLPASSSTFASDPSFVPRGELGVLLGPIPPIPPPGAIAARPAAVVDPAAANSSLLGDPEPLPVDPARASIWTTGPDGRYRIRGLAKGKLRAVAVAIGFAEARSREVSISPSQLVSGVDIVLTAGTYLVGKVTDTRGAPVAGAQVSARPEVGTSLEAFSDGDGMYRLGPIVGRAQLVAIAYGHVETRRSIEVAASKGRTPGEVREDIVLEVADAVLAGTLDDAAGAAVGGARIELIGGAGQGRSVVVNADGTFSLDGLPRGATRLRITHPSYPTTELDASASTTGLRARLRLPLGGQAEGVLLDDASGTPLAGLSFDARGPGGATAEATTDARGLWKLGPVRPGSWRLHIKLPGYLAYTRDLDIPVSHAPGVTSLRDIRIELARGGVLGGTVRDRRGNRIAGAQVTVRRADGSGTPVEADTDAQGEFRIHDCPTGELIVAAAKDDATGSARAHVRPGDETLGVTLEIR